MARSLTSRSTNPKIMDDNIKILDDAIGALDAPAAENVSYDNTDSGLTADDVQAAIDEVNTKFGSVENATANTEYMDSDEKMFYSKCGKIVIGSGRITLTSEKAAGQSNYLFSGLPVPIRITPVYCGNEALNMIINSSGYLTSNSAIPAGTYNISFAYIEI